MSIFSHKPEVSLPGLTLDRPLTEAMLAKADPDSDMAQLLAGALDTFTDVETACREAGMTDEELAGISVSDLSLA